MEILRALASLMGTDMVETKYGIASASFLPGTGDTIGGLSRLFAPTALGGLAGVLLSGKRGAGMMIIGALLGGGGTYLWDRLKAQINDANIANPDYAAPPAPFEEQAARLVRALVHAARSDGRLDESDGIAVSEQLDILNLGVKVKRLVEHALREPVNPGAIAGGVRSADEALRLYALSCIVIDVDQKMEKHYLDMLAEALHIPDSVKEELEEKLKP